MKIGILSDTHGYLHPEIFNFFKGCDEIWHAGDILSDSMIEELSSICKVRAVWGNCDDWGIRKQCNEIEVFDCDEHKVFLKHIIGRPANYDSETLKQIKQHKPSIVVAGHSHILQVIADKKNNWLFINPGAAGRFGPHIRLTFLIFEINGKEISNLKVWDEPK